MTTASRSDEPLTLRVLNCPTRISPFCTDAPERAMNPIIAETDRLVCVRASSATPPTSARGTLSMMSNAYRTRWNAQKSRARTSSKDSGTMIASR